MLAAVLAAVVLVACTAQHAAAPRQPLPSASPSGSPTSSARVQPPLALQHAAYLALPFTTIVSTGREDSVGRVFATGTTIRSHRSLQSDQVWCAIASTTSGPAHSVAFVRTSLRAAPGGGLTYGRFWVTDPQDCATAVAHVLDAIQTLSVDPVTGALSGVPAPPDVLDARADVGRFLTGHSPTQDLTTLGIQVYEAVLELGPSSY
jgi:hypothetical protein